jgi:hypothetical protein
MDNLKIVYSRDKKYIGKPTGSTRICQLEGCGGERIGVKWDNGKITYPCSKGMYFSPKGRSAKLI